MEVVTDAGGTQIWIKHPTRLHGGQGTDSALQVLATPAAYRAVLSAVRQESDKNHLDLGTSVANTGNGLHAVTLSVMQRNGRHVFQIHLREVARLLRAAIVIDDMGNDQDAARHLLALDYPLTLSVLPYLRYAKITAQDAHRRGREIMLHLPMEPEPGGHLSPGQGAILVGMNAAEVHQIVENDLAAVPYVAGVNNHMGSRATKDAALMADVMKTLADHRLYFIDSRTTAASIALEAARRQGLPAFYRTVFLDNTETVPYTLDQLRKFRHIVEQEGVALAIGHPHATTIAALEKFLPELEPADIELAAPSHIVRLPELARLHPPDKGN
ncbi:MAG TPA: divergent polysaccharide deacetylase family protein [Terriglobia bacterium]|nr:divergent polysaccharide deacetylase family protein [Terriglobia bacterium]